MPAQIASKRTVPFYGRVLVVPSPVDEDELPSGLVLPHSFDGDDGIVRGVIAAVDRSFDDEHRVRKAATELLREGTVVWYRGGYRLQGYVVLTPEDIYAIELDE